VGSRHQEQDCEGGKAQNKQYTGGWTKLLHMVSEPRMAHLKVGGLWYPISEASVQSQGFMSSAGHWPIVCVLGCQAQKWARITKNKTIRAVRPKVDNIQQVGPDYYNNSNPYKSMLMDAMWMNQDYAGKCSSIDKEPNADIIRFFKLLKDFDESLWDDCINHNKLSIVA